MDETLVIVTADHSHTLSINGYQKKGSNILGIARESKIDNIPYTTLSYATGGPAGFQMEVGENGKIHRKDPSREDTTSYTYNQQAAILTGIFLLNIFHWTCSFIFYFQKLDENTHGGADVTVHAMGPMAHLFQRVHEQSYVAHLISYAAKFGRFRENWSICQTWTINVFYVYMIIDW